MGVHSAYPGLTVEVHVNGKPVQEYEREGIASEECTVTRYIEATTAAKFQVVIHIPAGLLPKDVSINATFDDRKRRHGLYSHKSEQDRTEIIDTIFEKIGKDFYCSDTAFGELSISK